MGFKLGFLSQPESTYSNAGGSASKNPC